MLDYDSSLPQDVQGIVPIVPDQTENGEEAVFEKVEVVGHRALTEQSGKGKAMLPCGIITDRIQRDMWPRVAGQCSHRCLKSTADQEKLSHSNKLCIPALTRP